MAVSGQGSYTKPLYVSMGANMLTSPELYIEFSTEY